MKREAEEFFKNEKIEYYSVLDYSSVREINATLMERSGITPRSVLVFLLPYYSGKADNLSVYSASKDYHIIIKDITKRLIDLLSKLYPENKFCGFGDHSPIDERSAALFGGLGILGDNGLLINEKYGTYVFIADVISDVPPQELGAQNPLPIARCEGCGACKRACPTGILRGEGIECLSAITQRKGELRDDEIELMRKYNTVWGCDICQSVCPHNKAPRPTPIEFFFEERIPKLTSEVLDSMTKEQFEERAFAWRGRKTVKRNLTYLDM